MIASSEEMDTNEGRNIVIKVHLHYYIWFSNSTRQSVLWGHIILPFEQIWLYIMVID